MLRSLVRTVQYLSRRYKSEKRIHMVLSKNALAFTGLMMLGALAVVGYALHTIHPLLDYRFWVLFALALATARLKVTLPGLTGNMAVNLPFLLIAVAELSMLAALLVALPSCALQCFPKGGGKPKPVLLLFNLSTTAVAVAVASVIGTHLALLGVAAFFLAQTIPVAAIIRVTEGGPIHQIWCRIAHCSFPFYVLSAGITTIVTSSAPQLGWQVPLLSLLVMYATYRSYESYFRLPKPARG